jgi:hypothetical protein
LLTNNSVEIENVLNSYETGIPVKGGANEFSAARYAAKYGAHIETIQRWHSSTPARLETWKQISERLGQIARSVALISIDSLIRLTNSHKWYAKPARRWILIVM